MDRVTVRPRTVVAACLVAALLGAGARGAAVGHPTAPPPPPLRVGSVGPRTQ